MIKYKFRIKTKQEFIDEFGVNGWYRVRAGWHYSMDCLFGEEIDGECMKKIDEKHPYTITEKNGLLFYVSMDMLKEIRISPEYNNKKILIYD